MANPREATPPLLAPEHAAIVEIMTRGAVTVRAELGLEQLVDLFLDQGLSRVPVVDDEGRVIGVVSKTDLVATAHDRGDTEVSQVGAGGPGRHVHEADELVRDIMTPIAVTLPASTTIAEAARRMLANKLHAVPVTSDSDRGEVIGFLSATDFVAWVAGRTVGRGAR